MSALVLPALFIASSTEGLPVAYDIQEALEFDCHATVWKQGVFEPSRTVLEDLLERLKTPQFALFVFTPDDGLILRGTLHRAARDNVVFEMGLFIGAFGLQRCMHIVPRGLDDLHLPSDLLGLTVLDYPETRPDGNRLAALGPACNKIRRRLRQTEPAASALADNTVVAPVDTSSARLQHYLAAWQSAPLADDRALLRAGVVLDAHDETFPRSAMRRVFSFLESVSESVLSGSLDEAQTRAAFGEALVLFWPHAAMLLAPPNHADDFWAPLPSIATVFKRWR